MCIRDRIMVDNSKPLRHNGPGNDPGSKLSPYGGFPERDRAGVDYFGQTCTSISRCATRFRNSRASFFWLKDLATAPTIISASCTRLFLLESCVLTFLIKHLPELSFSRRTRYRFNSLLKFFE